MGHKTHKGRTRGTKTAFGPRGLVHMLGSTQGRKEIILRSNSPWGFCPFHHPDSPKGQVVRVSGELLPCMTRGSSHRPLRLLTGSPSMPHEPSRVVSRRGICLHVLQHGGVSCIGFTNPSVAKSGHAWQLRTEPLCSVQRMKDSWEAHRDQPNALG